MKARTKIRRKQMRSGVRWYVTVVNADGTEDGHGGYSTLREAKAKATELTVAARQGRYVARDRLTVGRYLLDEWLPSRENADVSTNTRDIYRTTVEAWIVPHIGDVPLQDLAPRDLDRLYRTLRTSGGRGGRPLRGKSVRNVHALLSKALGDGVRRGHLSMNPISAVDPPARDDSVERTAWTAEEVATFLDVASSDRLAAIWRVALATGLRRGELCGLTWDGVDLDGGSVSVARQVLVRPRSARGQRRVYVRGTTKTRRTRRVWVDAATAVELRRWKAEQASERLRFGGAWKTDGGLGVDALWVVTEPDGSVIHPDTVSRRWEALVERAGVTPITIHGARHSYAELALRAGVRLDRVSRQLGHASIATTANVYTHDADDAAAEAARLVGGVLDRRVRPPG